MHQQRRISSEEAAAGMLSQAAKAGMDPNDFFDLQDALFHADAGSYNFVRGFMELDDKDRLNFREDRVGKVRDKINAIMSAPPSTGKFSGKFDGSNLIDQSDPKWKVDLIGEQSVDDLLSESGRKQIVSESKSNPKVLKERLPQLHALEKIATDKRFSLPDHASYAFSVPAEAAKNLKQGGMLRSSRAQRLHTTSEDALASGAGSDKVLVHVTVPGGSQVAHMVDGDRQVGVMLPGAQYLVTGESTVDGPAGKTRVLNAIAVDDGRDTVRRLGRLQSDIEWNSKVQSAGASLFEGGWNAGGSKLLKPALKPYSPKGKDGTQ
jgi:hypothetical protein